MRFKLCASLSIVILLPLLLSHSSQAHRKQAVDKQDQKQGLQSLAGQREFYIGAAISIDPFRSEAEYLEILKREFNICVAENAFKFESLQPEKGIYRFDDADAIADFAQANGMKLRGHTLIWHNQLPKWVTEGTFNREAAIALMKDHIDTVAGRYRGRVWSWDVVNEAVGDNGNPMKDSFWFKSIGSDYVKLAFQFAHEADPDALLYYNDYSAEDMGAKSKAVYNLVREMKQRGVPIHGVGWQMHLDGNSKIGQSHRDNAKRLAELGLEISITELDVRISLPATQEDLSKQANTYRDVTQFCLSTPNCKAMVMWGLTDKYSWIPAYYPGAGAALLFDTDYLPKPAYSGVEAGLQNSVTSSPVIDNASIVDNNLQITGSNFDKKSVVFINWKQVKPSVDKQSPITSLLVKKFANSIGKAKKITLQVQNPEGKLSSEYTFARD
jgi:endo-1,4-beta-xylanase